MNTPEWIARSVSMLRTSAVASASATASTKTSSANEESAARRGMRERLTATLRRKPEALSPRQLRRALADLQSIVDSQVSEVEGGRRARAFADWYAGLSVDERRDVWLLMSEQFAPDAARVKTAREHYEANLGTSNEGTYEMRLRRALVSPRTRLLQRFAVYPEGMRFLVDMRADLGPYLKRRDEDASRLAALDAELESLFTTWFDVAFLELRRISWDSPASLIEKLIKYEAVHDIRGWSDVKNRLDSDRRCYGFFHPRLPNEPLIFVEVALQDSMSAAIAPLLDESAAAADIERATTAIFYSISNTQTGLRGVSFGDSLIKRVVETLREEFPRLRTFATLSPIPGFRSWLGKNMQTQIDRLDERDRAQLGREVGFTPPTASHVLSAAEKALPDNMKAPLAAFLTRCAAQYLACEKDTDRPLDPVARFHLGNGARVERLNWGGDQSPKGIKQSYGLMVNYLYDLKRLDKHRALLAQGKIPASSDIDGLCFE